MVLCGLNHLPLCDNSFMKCFFPDKNALTIGIVLKIWIERVVVRLKQLIIDSTYTTFWWFHASSNKLSSSKDRILNLPLCRKQMWGKCVSSTFFLNLYESMIHLKNDVKNLIMKFWEVRFKPLLIPHIPPLRWL